MKKVAVFVEGHTEADFIERLANEISGKKNVEISVFTKSSGDLISKKMRPVTSKGTFVLIYNCCNDRNVQKFVSDHCEFLERDGYSMILGVRDAYPDFTQEKIVAFSSRINSFLKKKSSIVSFHVSIMEVEAWFLQEDKHFQLISKKLTPERIKNGVGFDVLNHSAEDIAFPSDLLNKIYQLEGLTYTKAAKTRMRTINALSYENLYLNIRNKLPSFNSFLTEFDKSL